MKICTTTVEGACGMGVACDFGYGKAVDTIINSGGTGYISAGFRPSNPHDMKVFEEMELRGPCIFKTPVRTNINSGNDVFFAVFDWTNDEAYGFDAKDRIER
jgi:hypothetical protein